MAFSVGDIVKDCEIPYCLKMKVMKVRLSYLIVKELTPTPLTVRYKRNEFKFLFKI